VLRLSGIENGTLRTDEDSAVGIAEGPAVPFFSGVFGINIDIHSGNEI
jgi:hypothetical protein